jgi:methanogenic corrinoid protein MtbC1
MSNDERFEKLKNYMLANDNAESIKIAKQIKEGKEEDIFVVLRKTVPEVSDIVGEKFESGEYFLPQLVMAGDLILEVTNILEEGITIDESDAKHVIIIGTVENDVHTIGKNIVKTMLKTAGFKVIDIGEDVKADVFIDKAEEYNADIIAASCLMTTTLPSQRRILEKLASRGLRNKYKVLVGGGPVNQEWVDKIGADGFADDGVGAVKIAKELVGQRVR